MSPRFRSRFIRDILDVLERSDMSVASRLAAKLSPRLMRLLSEQVYRATDVQSTMRLDEAEDALLGIDAALGDGSGKVLESAGFMLGSRLLSRSGGVAIPGDLIRTISRLRTPVELPFEGVSVVFELEENPHGFQLQLGAVGNPRSTRIMSHLVVGYIKAAHTFGEHHTTTELSTGAVMMGDRALITTTFPRVITPPPESPVASVSRRNASRSRFPAARSLSAEVDRILERTSLPPTRRSSASFAAVRPPSGAGTSRPPSEASASRPPTEPGASRPPAEHDARYQPHPATAHPPREALPFAPTQPNLRAQHPPVRTNDTSGIQRRGRRDERREQDSSFPPPVAGPPPDSQVSSQGALRSTDSAEAHQRQPREQAHPSRRSGYNIRPGLSPTGTEEGDTSPTPPVPGWRHRE